MAKLILETGEIFNLQEGIGNSEKEIKENEQNRLKNTSKRGIID